MSKKYPVREIILELLLEINEEGTYCHTALGNTLKKYQFLPKQDRAFITRVCEGTVEYAIQIDYIINYFSKIKTTDMKPVIREILRSGVYQLMYMDSVPDSAACNESVKLAQKKGFYSLKPFVNGVLRTIARRINEVEYPPKATPVAYLSARYSMPESLVQRWVGSYGGDITREILKSFLEEKPVTVRISKNSDKDKVLESLRKQQVKVEKAPYLDYAYYISGYDHLMTLDAFWKGEIQVQDVSSMLVTEIAHPSKGNYIIDLCAAPGGKALHMAEKMGDFGMVDARDTSEHKVNLLKENILRSGAINIRAKRQDATVFDTESVLKADIVLADVPYSGYGVIGKKPDIKYKMSSHKQQELVILQRKILSMAVDYIKPGGVLIFSTCTIADEENRDNYQWLLDNYPLEPDSLNPYLPRELHCMTTSRGYLQLLPGVHKTDGFFMARLKKTEG